jgi:RbsD / FucU transport protein family
VNNGAAASDGTPEGLAVGWVHQLDGTHAKDASGHGECPRYSAGVLRFPVIHPPLLAALAACGHGGKVLLADANYSHSTNASPRAELIYLNVRPGLVTVDQVLGPVLAAVPVEAVHVMQPDEGPEPEVFTPRRSGRAGCAGRARLRPG